MGSRWETGRSEAFSDGVFAIAITLLVLDISVRESDFDDLARGIARQWPAYLAYVTSFLAVGAVRLAHHGVFARLAFVDRRIMQTKPRGRRDVRAAAPNLGVYGLVTLVAILARYVAAFGYLVIAVALIARARGDRPAESA